MNRTYWLGAIAILLLVSLLELAPRAYRLVRPPLYRVAIPANYLPRSYITRDIPQEYLQKQGMTFPPGSRLEWDDESTRWFLEVVNTRQNIVSFIQLTGMHGEPRVWYLQPMTPSYGYLFWQPHGYAFGLQHEREGQLRFLHGQPRAEFNSVSALHWGTPALRTIPSLMRSPRGRRLSLARERFTLAPTYVSYRGPAWPMVYLLLLLPYTFLYLLRRPLRRALLPLRERWLPQKP